MEQQDSVFVSKGEVEADKVVGMPLTQFEYVVDSLYQIAVTELKKIAPAASYLRLLEAVNSPKDELSLLRFELREEINVYHDTSDFREERIQTYYDTAQMITHLIYNGFTYPVDELKRYLTSGEDPVMLVWNRMPNQGARLYQTSGGLIVVMHKNIMSHFDPDIPPKTGTPCLTSEWTDVMYQPIGWHHDGMEVMVYIPFH